MLKVTPFQMGKLQGIIYDFPNSDDILPMHQHDEETIHITVVSRGSFKIRGEGWERIVGSGAVLDWRPNDPHEFIALEPNSRIVNIVKG